MARRRTFVVVMLLIVGAANPSWAQSPDAQAEWVGSRVRVTLDTGGPRLVGVVVESSPELLRVATSVGNVTAIPRSTVRRLEVHTGRKNRLLEGAAAGVAVGTLAGLTADVGGKIETRGQAIGLGVFYYGVPGVIIGALVKSDRWSVISPGVSLQPVLTPSRQGVSITLRF